MASNGAPVCLVDEDALVGERLSVRLADGDAAALREELAWRSGVYGLLARLFEREVDEELLASLRSEGFLADALARDEAESSEAGLRDALAVDFARLFIVRSRGTKHAAYPFESVYSPARRTMGDARDDVVACYRAAGLGKSDGWRVSEDHIALELDFMRVLGERAIEALATGDADGAADALKRQRDFLERHLLAWVPAFAEEMGRQAHTSFYRELAGGTVAFLKEDQGRLALLAREIESPGFDC